MSRPWNPHDFDSVFERSVCQEGFQLSGGRDYYLRYRSRYKECVRRFAALAPTSQVDVLDIGGGQLALLCAKLWDDRGGVADLPGSDLDYIAKQGIETYYWNLCKSDAPFSRKFDFIFFSEVIEHLPIPGHIVLERIRKILKPGGILICTTPNLYRLKNVVYMAVGHRIFDHFRYPEDDATLEHVLEYSRDHLAWQFRRAGFAECQVEYSQMHHLPTNPVFVPLAILGYPLHMLPRWRDNLVATASVPAKAS